MKETLLCCLLALCAAALLLPSAFAATDGVPTPEGAEEWLRNGGFPSAKGRMELLGDTSQKMEAEVKAAIYEGLKNHDEVIDVSRYALASDSYQTYNAWYNEVVNEHGDLFYVVFFDWEWGRHGGQTILKCFRPIYDENFDEDKILAFRDVCDGIVAQLDDWMTDEQKYLFLHDYLVTHCEYDKTFSGYDAYSALVNGSAVCQGYSLAYSYLAELAGLDAQIVSSKAQNHAWNIVELDGAYYHVDCTWDDPSNDWYAAYCRHVNFLRGRDGIVATGHSAGTDWVSRGENVYDLPCGTRYDEWYWTDVVTAIPMIGGYAAYTKASDAVNVYLRDELAGTEQAIPLASPSLWPVWGETLAYWVGSNSSVAAVGNAFYFSTPTEILRLTPDGGITTVYTLSDEERESGYLYGVLADGDGLAYWLGTRPSSTTFARKTLELTGAAPAFEIACIRCAGDHVAVYLNSLEGARLLVASYNADGRLTCCAALTPDARTVRLDVDMKLSGAARAAAFLIDAETGLPLCAGFGRANYP